MRSVRQGRRHGFCRLPKQILVGQGIIAAAGEDEVRRVGREPAHLPVHLRGDRAVHGYQRRPAGSAQEAIQVVRYRRRPIGVRYVVQNRVSQQADVHVCPFLVSLSAALRHTDHCILGVCL